MAIITIEEIDEYLTNIFDPNICMDDNIQLFKNALTHFRKRAITNWVFVRDTKGKAIIINVNITGKRGIYEKHVLLFKYDRVPDLTKAFDRAMSII